MARAKPPGMTWNCAVAIGGGKDPQTDRPGLNSAVDEHGGRGTVHAGLCREGRAVLAHSLQQVLPLALIEHRGVDRPMAPRGNRRADHQFIEVGFDIRPVFVASAPPRRHGGQLQIFAQLTAADGRQEGHQRGCFQQSAAQGVGHHDLPAASGLHESGHAVHRVVTQLQGIGLFVVHAAQDDIDRQEAAEGLQVDARAADGQVVAFNERIAQVAGEVGILEVARTSRSGREEHDTRIVGPLHGKRLQCVAEGDEESRQAFHVQAVKVGGQDAGRDDPILQGQACSRRTLGVVGVRAPTAVDSAHEVPGIQVQEDISRRRNAVAGQQEAGLTEDQLRRDQALADQVLRTVKIGQNQVEQLHPLGQRGGQRVPLALGQ